MTGPYWEEAPNSLQTRADEALVSELQQIGYRSERGAKIMAILFGRHFPRLEKIVLASYANLLTQQAAEDAKDLALEHLEVIFFRKLKSFEPRGSGSFKRWLNTTFRNFLKNRYRHLRRRESQSLDELVEQSRATRQPLHGSLSHAAPQDPCDLLDDPCISAADRELLTLHYISGLSLEQCATATGKSVSAIRMQLSRSRKRLKKRLQKQVP